MKSQRHTKFSPLSISALAGFTLVELAIVLGVVGVIIGGIWGYASLVQQSANVEQSVEAISSIVDSMRANFGGADATSGKIGVTGGVPAVTANLIAVNGIPANLLSGTSTTCAGVTNNYPQTPFGTGVSATSACGSLRVCAWIYPLPSVPGSTSCTNTKNNPATPQQYFGIEFLDIDYASCLGLLARITPSTPTNGLKDVYINGASVLYGNSGATLPVSPTTAQQNCTTGAATNVVDFIYYLHAPNT